MIVEQCLDDISLSIEDYDLTCNQSIIASHNWMGVVRSARSLILVVSLVDTNKEGSSDPSTALTHRNDHCKPVNTHDVADEGSSDSSSDEDEEIAQAQASMKPTEVQDSHDPQSNALILRPHHRPIYIRPSSREINKGRRHNLEKVQELERTGLIINEPNSLAPKKKVKMYSLKLEAEPTTQAQAQSSFPDAGRSMHQAFVTDEDENTAGRAQTSGKTSTREKQPPESTPKTPKLALRVPPFFAWSLDQPAANHAKPKTTFDVSKSSGLKSVLSGVERKILARDLDLKRHYEQFLQVRASVDRSSIYRETPITDLENLDRMKKPLNGDLENLRQRLAAVESSAMVETLAPASSNTAFVLNPPNDKDDPFVLKQKIALQTELRSLVDCMEDLVACFVPRSYDHYTMKKIWGALGTLITVGAVIPMAIELCL